MTDHYHPTEEALRVAEQCYEALYPILAGEPAMIQGAALCELVARHLAGHVIPNNPKQTAELRRMLLEAFVATVEDLIAVTDQFVIQPELKRRGQ